MTVGPTARSPTSAGPSSSSRSRGRRPGFTDAAPPELAERRYERFAAGIRAAGLTVAMGSFGAEMQVELVNDGPFTIWLDSADRGPSGDAKDRPSDDDRSVP